MDPAPEGFPFRFRCRRSGNCCSRPEGLVRVTPDDVARIADHLGLSQRAVRSRYVASTGDRLAEGASSRCVFLTDGAETACSIYPVRPEPCRSWPYWPQLAREGPALRDAARLCPGIALAARRKASGGEE